jgi:hypothetical protein
MDDYTGILVVTPACTAPGVTQPPGLQTNSHGCPVWTHSHVYLLGLKVLRALGGGLQAPARQLPGGGHRTCSDIALRVLEQLPGERRCL